MNAKRRHATWAPERPFEASLAAKAIAPKATADSAASKSERREEGEVTDADFAMSWVCASK